MILIVVIVLVAAHQISEVIACLMLFFALARTIIGQIAFSPITSSIDSTRVVLPYFSMSSLIIFSSY